MSSTLLSDYKGNLADIPGGNEDISVEGQADSNDDASTSNEMEVVANPTGNSSDDDSAPKLDVKPPRSKPNRQITAHTEAVKSVSSNSDSDSDSIASGDKKPRAEPVMTKRARGVSSEEFSKAEKAKKNARVPKKQRMSLPTSVTASAMQSTSVAHVDYSAMLPKMSMSFGTEPFMNVMLGVDKHMKYFQLLKDSRYAS
eukprot:scaffold149423_cov60-Attheya_sp.AAC.3